MKVTVDMRYSTYMDTTMRKHGPVGAMLVNVARMGQHGQPAMPRSLILVGGTGETNRSGTKDEGYCEYYYWSPAHWSMTFADWKKVVRLSKRYRRFCDYVTETLPAWKEVRRVGYADNSEESVQHDKFGNERRVTVVGPHGDLCF